MSLCAAVGTNPPNPTVKAVPINLRCEYQVEPLGIDSPTPRLSWELKENPKAFDQVQTAYRILVSRTPDLLKAKKGDLWDSGMVSGSAQNNIPYGGVPLKSGQTCFWRVGVWTQPGEPTWSKVAKFETGLLHAADWTAKWINDGKSNPETDPEFYQNDPAPLFRKEFTVRAPISKARLYITGLGYYEATLNGVRIGDHLLDPGWTAFDKRVFCSVFDLTKKLKQGRNCLGAIVGNGWYNPLPLKLFGSFNLREHLVTGRPRLIAQLQIDYQDGTSQTVATDTTWKVGESGILQNSIYLGEIVDARKQQAGWNKPGFDDSSWQMATISPDDLGPRQSQPQPPIRSTKSWNAVKVSTPKPGVYIYDLGVNFAGWLDLKLNLPAGTELRLRYGELLHKDGTLNPMTSVAGQVKSAGVGGPGAPDIAWQTDTYITKGGRETYTPKFTFHGFRYVEITGLAQPLPLASVTGHLLNADVEEAGSFECSNPMLNQIQTICRRTFLSNLFSVQSDCPHRERLGYGGDIVATSEAYMLNYNMARFYEKVVQDFSDAARPDGMLTDTAPFIGIQYCGVIWAMAHPLLVDQLYQYYGDRQIGGKEYAVAKKWLQLVEKQYPDGIVTQGLSDHESLTPNPAPEMVTPLYYQCANLLATIADRLNLAEDRTYFTQLADKIRTAYNERFVDPTTGRVGPGTQASQSFALATRIIPDEARRKALDFLIKDIDQHQGHLTTGILGTKFMLDVLSREGHADVAYRIATQPDFPGWGWTLKNGATTLWEHWEFSDNTFSHNHPMFGSVSQWMMNWLGGIQPAADAEAFDRIVIEPQTPDGLDWVKSSYQSIRGKIVSNWTRRKGDTQFEIVVPPNSSARITLPARSARQVTQNGKPLVGGSPTVTVGSGHYTFIVTD